MRLFFSCLILCLVSSISYAREARHRCQLRYISNTGEAMIATAVANGDSELVDGDRLTIRCANKPCHIPTYVDSHVFTSCTKISTQGGYLFVFGDDVSITTEILVFKIINSRIKLILEDASWNGFKIYRKAGRTHVISYRQQRFWWSKFRPVDYTLGNTYITSVGL